MTYKECFHSSLFVGIDKKQDLEEIGIKDLVVFYKAAKKCFDDSIEFKEASRNEVVQLQQGK